MIQTLVNTLGKYHQSTLKRYENCTNMTFCSSITVLIYRIRRILVHFNWTNLVISRKGGRFSTCKDNIFATHAFYTHHIQLDKRPFGKKPQHILGGITLKETNNFCNTPCRKSTLFRLVHNSFPMAVYEKINVLVLFWTKNSDWNLTKILLHNHYKPL